MRCSKPTCHLPGFAGRIDGITDYAVDGDLSLFSSPEEFWSKYHAPAALEPPTLRDRSRDCVWRENRRREIRADPSERETDLLRSSRTTDRNGDRKFRCAVETEKGTLS